MALLPLAEFIWLDISEPQHNSWCFGNQTVDSGVGRGGGGGGALFLSDFRAATSLSHLGQI